MTRAKPRVALIPGDPNGVGPELTARLLATPEVGEAADVLLIGDRHVIARGVRDAGVSVDLPELASATEAFPGIALLPVETIGASEITPGRTSEAGGRSVLTLLRACLDLGREGTIDGFIFAPLNKAAMHMAGLGYEDEMQYITAHLGFEGPVGELNVLDRLWTSRVTSHVPLKDVGRHITDVEILRAIRLLDGAIRRAGVARPKLATCGLNPHAGDGGNFGSEEIELIGPTLARAQAENIDIDGPWPADTIFVRARDRGDVDGIVTMYHDQGQIAMKMMGFERGVTACRCRSRRPPTALPMTSSARASPGSTRCSWRSACWSGWPAEGRQGCASHRLVGRIESDRAGEHVVCEVRCHTQPGARLAMRW